MRQVRYNVAASLDGYIAGPQGEFDWIPQDPSVDFAGLFAQVDTVLVGRVTYEATLRMGGGPWKRRTRVYVFSTTLRQSDDPKVTIVGAHDAAAVVASLRAEPGGGQIWLFGGGRLFRSLLIAGQVDRVEVTVCPILLGGGTPVLPPDTPRTPLRLVDISRYPSGMVTLTYDVARLGTSD
jgi:dihydrofolate reductase